MTKTTHFPAAHRPDEAHHMDATIRHNHLKQLDIQALPELSEELVLAAAAVLKVALETSAEKDTVQPEKQP